MNTQTPSAPASEMNPWNALIPLCTIGHNHADNNATGTNAKNPTITTKLEPLNVPIHSGSFVSKNLLCSMITIPEIINAPIIPMSNVLMLATIVKPLVPPTSAAKSTPKFAPH